MSLTTTRPEAPSQADLNREEQTTQAEYRSATATLTAAPSPPARTEHQAKQAAYFQAVDRAMEFCRPQAELASHYFDETARAIYIDANDVCRRLGEDRIKAEVVAVIEGGTRVLVRAGAHDRGNPKPGRNRAFRSYATRYEDCRRNGLSHEDALVELERLSAR